MLKVCMNTKTVLTSSTDWYSTYRVNKNFNFISDITTSCPLHSKELFTSTLATLLDYNQQEEEQRTGQFFLRLSTKQN